MKRYMNLKSQITFGKRRQSDVNYRRNPFSLTGVCSTFSPQNLVPKKVLRSTWYGYMMRLT